MQLDILNSQLCGTSSEIILPAVDHMADYRASWKKQYVSYHVDMSLNREAGGWRGQLGCKEHARHGTGGRRHFRGVNLRYSNLKSPWLSPSVEKIVLSIGPDILEHTS